MAIYKMRNLGKYGVITDIPSYDLPIEAWTDAKNIRFVAGRVEKMGGYTPAIGTTSDHNTPMIFCQEPETSALLYATEKNIIRVEGVTHTNISKTVDAYDAKVAEPWDYTYLSNCIIFNQPNGDPQGWISNNTTVTKMADLPGWGYPDINSWNVNGDGAPIDIKTPGDKQVWTCQRIRGYKNYLIALNMKEGAQNYPQRLRWSDVADVNSFPPNWIENNSTTDGAFVDLSDCTGSIIDGRPMRDYFLIYTDRETYIMRFVGGDFVFDIQKLFPDSGLLNANCVCDYEGGNHFVISQEDIFTHDGSTRQSVVTDIIKEKLLGEITASNFAATKVFAYPTRKEIWITYPTKTAEDGTSNFANDKAAVWNWKTGAWSFADVPDVMWVNEVISPDLDIRSWANPDRKTGSVIKPITKLVLDSPIYSLAVDDSFRIDVIYQPGEGLTGSQSLVWTTSDDTIAKFSPNEQDNSAIITGIKEGTVTMTVALSSDATKTDSYTIKITKKGDLPGDRHQESDDHKNEDPLEPKPPTPGASYRPDQPEDKDNQWETLPPDQPNQHANENWEKKGFSFSNRSLIACSSDKNFYFLDTGTNQIRAGDDGISVKSTVPVIAEITKYGISLSDVEDGLYRHKTFRTIYPLMSGEGTLRFNVGGSNDAYDQPSFSESHMFKIGEDYKVDTFVNFRYLAYSIRDEGEGRWSFSGMDIDYFLGGNR